MMKDEIAHFDQVRFQNKRIIKNLLRKNDALGKSDLAQISSLSFPTVSSVIKELTESGEIIETPNSVSRGGRPGAIFSLNPDFTTGLCAWLGNDSIHFNICDAKGNFIDNTEIAVTSSFSSEELLALFSNVKAKYKTLSAISLGIPGVVLDGSIKRLPCFPNLDGKDIAFLCKQTLGIPLFLENDINTVVCAERNRWQSLAHIFFQDFCIGTGFLINGELLRGSMGFAGELQNLSESIETLLNMARQSSDAKQRQELLIKVSEILVTAITCVLNPADLAISCDEFDEDCIQKLNTILSTRIEEKWLPHLHLVKNNIQLYETGLKDLIINYWSM